MGTSDNNKEIGKIVLQFNQNQMGHGIRIESAENFGSSIFRDSYYNAFQMIGQIIAQNDRFEDVQSNYIMKDERLYNIMTICGGRGNGKSSSVCSLLGALEKNDKELENFLKSYKENFFVPDSCKLKRKGDVQVSSHRNIEEVLNNTAFICLDVIDASLLEEHECILDVILAKMLQKYDEVTGKNYYREPKPGIKSREDIFLGFEDIYRDYHNMKSSSEDKAHYGLAGASLEVIKNLSGSLDLRKSIDKFVREYVKSLAATNRSDYNKQYLVICIDDLDLNSSGYKMLEEIHKYLMIPGVIILLSVSSMELLSLVQTYYKEKQYDHSRELAIAYIDKVMPVSQRVYLPALIDSHVLIAPNEKTIKETILYKIARRTGVFYDGCGYKIHFYEVQELRTLLNLYYMFEDMQTLKATRALNSNDDWHRYLYVFDSNIDKLHSDIVNRMAEKKFSHTISKDMVEARDLFTRFSQEDAARKGALFIQWFITLVNRRFVEPVEERLEYSYGDFLYALNKLSNSSNRSYKPLVHCILAEMSVVLTRIFIHSMHEPEETKDQNGGQSSNSRKAYKEQWKECLGDSICGKWSKRLLPKWKKGVEYVEFSDSIFLLDSISVQISNTKEWKSADDNEKMLAYIIENVIKQEGFIKGIEYLCMLMRVKSNSSVDSISIDKSDVAKTMVERRVASSGNVDQYEIEDFEANDLVLIINSSQSSFEILGFAQIDDYYEFLNSVKQKITNSVLRFCEYKDESSAEYKNARQKIEYEIKQRSVIQNVEKWKDKYECVLPISSVDIMYNIFKRVSKKMGEEMPTIKEAKEMIPAIKKCYESIALQLRKEDAFYGGCIIDHGDNAIVVSFEDSFINFPLVDEILNKKDDSITFFEELLIELFEKIGYSSLLPT